METSTMQRTTCLLVLTVAALTAFSQGAFASPLALFVSPTGNDGWSGTKAAPARNHQDGPLATLDRAVARIRSLSAAGKLSPDGVIVSLQPGTYNLDHTLSLSASDGAIPCPLTFQASKPGQAIVTGGKQVTDWAPVTDPLILARLASVSKGHVLQANLKAQGVTDFGALTSRGFGRPITPAGLELFFNGAPMPLSRWPNDGQWATIAGDPKQHTTGSFSYDGDRPSRWAKDDDVWVHGYWTFDWADTYEKVTSIDTQNHVIHTTEPGGAFGYTQGHRWYALNILEELDQPGEWYLDRKSGMLYFWPPSDLKAGRATVSVIGDLVRVDQMSNVTFKGLAFSACRASGISINGGSHDIVTDCTITNIGNRGVNIINSTGSGVENSTISQTGDGGVELSGGDRKTLAPSQSFVSNCVISNYSRWSRTYRPAVQVDGVGNLVSHNEMAYASHNAIQLGGNDNTVEYNNIHDVCRETGDVGAFYMGRDWTMRGNVIRYNYIHNIGGGTGMVGFSDASAIYLDDTAAGTQVYGNVCVGANRGVLVGGGRDDVVTNNVFVNCRVGVSLDARGIGWAAKYLLPHGGWEMQEKLAAVGYDQPPYTKYPHLANILNDDPASPKYDVISKNIYFNCKTPLEIDEKAKPGATIEDNMIDADPVLAHEMKGSNLSQPNAPIFVMGFEPIPFDKIGPQRK
jgi:hypothetical protein